MKIKILTFFGLIIAGIGMLSLVQSSPVHAAGERYVWISQNTIEATGGGYSGLGKTLVFTRQANNTYRAVSNGGNTSLFFNCGGITWTLTVGADSTTSSLAISTALSTTCDVQALNNAVDKNVKIDNVINAPPMEGQDVEYRTVNCSAYYEGGEAVTRCEAVQSCVKVHNLAVLDCLRSWHTCTIINTTNRQKCVDAVTAGKLDEAIKGGISVTPPPKGEENTSSCVIPGLGWLICPVINTLASLTDGAYYIVGEFLKIQPILTTGDTAGLYSAWQVMRNIANIAFVIVFLIIIFSQVTSAGISNYGIKRLLPRLIVAAVLVNISYWICAAAVDLSNITGSSLTSLFDAISNQITVPVVGADSTGVGMAGVVGGILAWSGAIFIVYIALGALIPVLLSSLVIIAGVFITLIIRQALIVLLIAISPLAFVAYLLPNTEGLFRQWRELFWTLLIMYPLVALLFGACALASRIVSAGT